MPRWGQGTLCVGLDGLRGHYQGGLRHGLDAR